MASVSVETLRACETDGAVVSTVASADYLTPLRRLARSTLISGFRCLVVQPYTPLPTGVGDGFRQLSVPDPPLLPRPEWCNTTRFGWRRSHLYRSRMWRVVLSHGFDMIAVDLDWSFTDIHDVPLQPAQALLPALRAARTPKGEVASVIAPVDGHSGQFLFFNVGLMWVRSSRETIALARRCEARSVGGWEQGLFNEELNFGDGPLGRITCCIVPFKQSDCNLARHLRKIDNVHDLGHQNQLRGKRLRAEGVDRCTDAQSPAPLPPSASEFIWLPTNSTSWANSGNESEKLELLSAAKLAAGELQMPGLLGERPKGGGAWSETTDNLLLARAHGRCNQASNLCRCSRVSSSQGAYNDDEARIYGEARWQRVLKRNPAHRVYGDAFVQAVQVANASRAAELRRWQTNRTLRAMMRRPRLLEPVAPNGSVLLKDWLWSRPSFTWV